MQSFEASKGVDMLYWESSHIFGWVILCFTLVF